MLLGVRECLVPRPRFVFAFADYDGLELRTMAQACLTVLKRSRLAEVLNSGIDPHCDVASEVLGMPYPEVRGIYKEGKGNPLYHKVYQARQMGKVANFGLPGGLGATKLVAYAAGPKYRVTLTENEAKSLKQMWLNKYPEFRDYFMWINDVVRGGDPFVQIFSGRLRGGIGFTDGANTAFQGLGGDATKAAGYALTKECRIGTGPLGGGHPIVYVHDEFWAEVREEVAHEAAEDLGRIMCEAANVFLPDVPAKAEPGLARRWSKHAKRITQEGRIVPWDG